MKSNLKEVIQSLDPKILGSDKIKISSLKKLGVGEGNINYLLETGNKKFICRINLDKKVPKKSKEEFSALKKIERLEIAPKPYYFHPKDNNFPFGFIILEFIEGKALRSRKRKYENWQIKELASVLSKLHSQKWNSPKTEYSYDYFLKKNEEYHRQINRQNNSLKKQFTEIQKRIKSSLPKEEHEFGLIHGDVCPQNIVETKDKKLKLIDWESLQYSDPAKDITNILVDMELKGENLELFLKEYQKIRKDKTILERAKTYAILFRYNYFLWEIRRSFEIINKELPKEYLAKTTAKSHINEAKFQYKKFRELIEVPRIKINLLFRNLRIA